VLLLESKAALPGKVTSKEMETANAPSDETRRPEWGCKIGLVVESEALIAEINAAAAEGNAVKVFEMSPSTPSFEVAGAVEQDQPEVLFVEFALASKAAAEWLTDVRRGAATPLVIAVHPTADPLQMISALRAGASEFLSLPIRPAVHEAMERLSGMLESKRHATVESGRIIGVVSSKGGCGATSLACHLSAAIQLVEPRSRILVADMDYQSPGAPEIFRKEPSSNAGAALESVRRLSPISWREFVTPVKNGVDFLASPASSPSGEIPELPEPWRMEGMLRFAARHYNWVLVDLGRHLNPANWTALQHIEDLLLVTIPDVLALYQTRSILQTLTVRGFDRSHVKLILNRNNQAVGADFWVESVKQMFEIGLFGVIPDDESAMNKLPGDHFEFPADTTFGRSVSKIALKLIKPDDQSPARKAA
jgi:pilus assembly protein CpaE